MLRRDPAGERVPERGRHLRRPHHVARRCGAAPVPHGRDGAGAAGWWGTPPSAQSPRRHAWRAIVCHVARRGTAGRVTRHQYRELRRQVGTQAEAAQALGVQPVTVSRRERGVRAISREAELALRYLVERRDVAVSPPA